MKISPKILKTAGACKDAIDLLISTTEAPHKIDIQEAANRLRDLDQITMLAWLHKRLVFQYQGRTTEILSEVVTYPHNTLIIGNLTARRIECAGSLTVTGVVNASEGIHCESLECTKLTVKGPLHIDESLKVYREIFAVNDVAAHYISCESISTRESVKVDRIEAGHIDVHGDLTAGIIIVEGSVYVECSLSVDNAITAGSGVTAQTLQAACLKAVWMVGTLVNPDRWYTIDRVTYRYGYAPTLLSGVLHKK